MDSFLCITYFGSVFARYFKKYFLNDLSQVCELRPGEGVVQYECLF